MKSLCLLFPMSTESSMNLMFCTKEYSVKWTKMGKIHFCPFFPSFAHFYPFLTIFAHFTPNFIVQDWLQTSVKDLLNIKVRNSAIFDELYEKNALNNVHEKISQEPAILRYYNFANLKYHRCTTKTSFQILKKHFTQRRVFNPSL